MGNVKNLLSKNHRHNFDAYLDTMESLGYTNYYKVLNAKDYGVPQHRERVFTISIRNDINKTFEFPSPIELNKTMQDVLESDVNGKYYLSNKMINYISQTGTKNFKNGDCKINLQVARPLSTCQNKRAGTTNYICDILPLNFNLSGFICNAEFKIRRLTPLETWRLMGYDDSDYKKCKDLNSDTQLYKQAGNSIVVPY